MAKELGTTGLVEFAGQISDDFLREMRGKEGYKKFDEMRRNSPIIGALMLANELSIRKVSWNFTDADAAEGATSPRVELLERAKDNMSTSWNDFIVEVLTMLPFGYSLFEICYERVDSAVLWRKFAPRGQDTIYRWNFDDTGGLTGVTQQAAPRYNIVEIPIDKLLLFRTRVERGNPEGRSILRTAWIPYYYAKHIMQVEAIGIERDLAGLPKITLPQGADTTDTDTSDYGVAHKLVRNVRNDEQAGIVLPFGWEFELVSTGGSRQFDTDKIVRRYESRMLMSALAQFIMLGQDGVGSLALSKDASDFFTMAVNAVADIISETFTKYAIPRLLKLNGYDAEGVCLEHTPAGDVDTTAIADFLQKVGSYVTWDAEDELWLRQLIGLPEKDTNELQEQRDEAREMENAKSKAILEQMNQAKEQGGKMDGKEMPMKEKEKPEDEYSVSHYAANAPDDAKRRKMERQLQKLIEAHMARTRRNVVKAAREMKQGSNFEATRDESLIERFMGMFAKAPRGDTNVTVHNYPGKEPIVNVKPPDVHVTTTLPAAPPANVTFAPVIQPSQVVNQNNIKVEPTPVQNNITVQPADVIIEKGKREAKITRDANGRITSITADDKE